MVRLLLPRYLELEQELLALAEEDTRVDALYDEMDRIWYALTDEERKMLNTRTQGDESS